MRDLRFTRPRGGQKSSLPVPKDSRLNAQRKGLGETIAYEVKIPGECHNNERSPSTTSYESSLPSTVIRRSMTNTPLSSTVSDDRPASLSKGGRKEKFLDDANSDPLSDAEDFPEVQVLVDESGSPIPSPKTPNNRPATAKSDQFCGPRVGWSPFPSLKSMRQKPQLPEPERSPSPLPLDNLPQTPAKNEGTPLPSFRRLSGLGSSTKRDSDRPRSGMASLRKALVNVFGGPSKLRRSKIPAFEGPGAAGEESRPVYRNSKQANTVGPVGVPSEWKSTASPSKKRSSLRGKTLRTSRSEFPPHSTPSPINTRPSSNSVNSRARSQRRPALPFMDSSNYAVRTMQANSHRNDEPISPTKMSPTKVGDKHTFLIRRVSVLQEQLQAAQHELMMIEQNGLKPKPHVLANKSSGSDQEDRSSPNKVPPMTDTKAGHTPSNPNLLYPGKENLRSTRSAYTLRPRQSDYEHNNTAPACVSSLPKTFSHCRLRTNGENNDKRNPARQSIQSLFYPNGLSDEEVMRRGSQASATSFTDHRAEGRDREAAYRALSERFEVPHQNTILKHRVSSPVRDAQTEGSLRRNISPVRKVAVNLGNNLPSPNLHNPDRQVSSDPHKSLPEPHSKRPVNRGPSQSFIPIASSVPPGNSTFNLPTLFDTPRQKPQSHQPHVYPPDHPISVVPGRTSTESVPPLPPLPRFEVTRGSYGPTNQTHRFPLHSLLEPGDESFEWPVECL